MRTRTLLLGALLATAALLAACSSGPPPLGTGGLGSAAGYQCNPVPLGHPLTVGVWVLDNTGTSPVTVTSVRLQSPHGLAMTTAWLMPVYRSPRGNWTYLGVVAGYPPTTWPEWPKRVPVPGAVIKPRQSLNLFFGLTRTGLKDGRTSGAVITYTASGNAYTLQEDYGFVITAKKSCPLNP